MYTIVFVLLLCVSALSAFRFTDCGSTVGHYTSITISGCPEEEETCILRRKTNVTLSMIFDVEKDITAVNAVGHAILADVPVPFVVENPDGCAFEGSGLKCPLTKAGGPYTYTSTVLIEKSTPKISLVIKWQLQNEDEEDIVCFEYPVKIE